MGESEVAAKLTQFNQFGTRYWHFS